MAITFDSTLKEVLANPEATALLEQYSPGFSKNPQLQMALGMKLGMCVKFPQAKMTAEQVAALEEDLKKLG